MGPLARCVPAVLSLVCVVGCGGGGGSSAPSRVPTPAPTPTPAAAGPVVVRNGWTEEEVAVGTSPASPSPGTTVVVEAPGFLRRDQRFDGSPLFLWPSEESYVRELVYDWEFTDGTRRLVRWAQPFSVALDGDLADDPAVVAKTQEVLAEITGLTGLPLTIAPGGACRILINPSIREEDNAIAETFLTFRSTGITAARVEFATRREISGGAGSDYRNTLLHEMGHVMGLSHSSNARDVMTPGAGPGSKEGRYQTDEGTCLHMMYAHRQPGNFPPDRDPVLGAAASATQTVVIID